MSLRKHLPRDEDFARAINARLDWETAEFEQPGSTIAVRISALIAVAALAGYLLARRASRIDPMVALQYE